MLVGSSWLILFKPTIFLMILCLVVHSSVSKGGVKTFDYICVFVLEVLPISVDRSGCGNTTVWAIKAWGRVRVKRWSKHGISGVERGGFLARILRKSGYFEKWDENYSTIRATYLTSRHWDIHGSDYKNAIIRKSTRKRGELRV